MTKEKCLALFLLAGFDVSLVWELPNKYWPDVPDYAKIRKDHPWWLVKTEHGLIEIGWRKKVIHISWEDTVCRQHVTSDVHVTTGLSFTHAWSYSKALEYLTKLRECVTTMKPIVETDLVLRVEAFVARVKNGEFADDLGVGFYSNQPEKWHTGEFVAPSHLSKPDWKAPPEFTHVVWVKR